MSHADTEVVLVTERFHPDTTSSTGQYMTDLATGLQGRGTDVTVLTRKIHAHSDEDTQQRLDDAGVTVRRTPVPDVPQCSLLTRLCNWFTFLAFAIPMLLFSSPEQNREVVFVTYPSILPPLMWGVCRLKGWEYTYIVYDYYPEAAVELEYISRGAVVHRLWQRCNQHLLVDARNIVALGPQMRQEIIDSVAPKYEPEFNPDKIHIIHNWANPEFITPRDKADNWFAMKHNTQETFTLVYSGNIGEFHDLETIVEGVAMLDDTECKALIIGEGDNKEAIRELAARKGVLGESVELLPYQPWEDVPYSFTAGDVSVVAVNPEFEGLCVSSKLYSALAAGQPVLVVAEESSDEAQIVEQFDAGVQVSPGDRQGFIEAIREWQKNPALVDEHGEHAREAFEANFTKEHSVDEYHRIIAQ